MIAKMITVDNLIEIVNAGGQVKTGVDVYNEKGILLLDKAVLVDKPGILERIKKAGIRSVPVNPGTHGGLWDGNGREIIFSSDGTIDISAQEIPRPDAARDPSPKPSGDVEKRIREIDELKKESAAHYNKAKGCIKQAVEEIRKNKGQFDVEAVETHVARLGEFLVSGGHPFAYLNRELFAYDDYMLNHSINVCAIGTAVLYRFNTHFSGTINHLLSDTSIHIPDAGLMDAEPGEDAFTYYYGDELKDICLGFFLYDIGKVMVPQHLLNKTGGLTRKEFDVIKRHSYDFGLEILQRNRIRSAVLKNIVAYHHGPLFAGEKDCYPDNLDSKSLPLYVRICKLADIYDAMTSKRSYNEAANQISAVTELFRKYVKKDVMLQFILHAFVKAIGIYPPGSIVYLANGQMAYVLESNGPLVIPFTDTDGMTLGGSPDPIDLSGGAGDKGRQIDTERAVRTPKDVYALLPEYLRQMTLPAG